MKQATSHELDDAAEKCWAVCKIQFQFQTTEKACSGTFFLYFLS